MVSKNMKGRLESIEKIMVRNRAAITQIFLAFFSE